MKYLIQLFRTTGDDLGVWVNTAWGGDDRDAVAARLEQVAKTLSRQRPGFTRVRMVEVLEERSVAP